MSCSRRVVALLGGKPGSGSRPRPDQRIAHLFKWNNSRPTRTSRGGGQPGAGAFAVTDDHRLQQSPGLTSPKNPKIIESHPPCPTNSRRGPNLLEHLAATTTYQNAAGGEIHGHPQHRCAAGPHADCPEISSERARQADPERAGDSAEVLEDNWAVVGERPFKPFCGVKASRSPTRPCWASPARTPKSPAKPSRPS